MAITAKQTKIFKNITFQAFVQALLIAIALMYVIPLLWMVFTSLKSLQEIQLGKTFFPSVFHF